MPFGIGIWEGLILLLVLTLLFGAKGVPAAARRLGRSVREVKEAVAEVDPRRMLDEADERNAPRAVEPQAAPARQREEPLDS
jgi:sec-independent protein translocase protein TatA